MFNAKQLLFLAPLANFAFADLELDRDDVPPPCRDICQPIVDLTNRCQVDLPSDRDRDEDLLERQCVCTNDSFDVGRIAGLCASCFQQNFRAPDRDDDDDDDNTEWDDDDIREIVRDCGFSSASYSSQLSTAAQTINVVATAPTATEQLTTTISQGSNNNSPSPTDDSGNSNNNDSNNDSNNSNDDSNNSNDNNDNNDDSSNNSNDNNNNDDEDGLGVPGAVPLAGFSGAAVLYAFGAVAAGGALLL